jgi:polysaccharide biosynthesis protein PslH
MRKNILIIAADLPLPVISGTTLRFNKLFNKLKEEFNLFYAVRFSDVNKKEYMALNKDIINEVIFSVNPRPNYFKKVIICIKSLLKVIPPQCEAMYFPSLSKKIREFLEHNNMDIIHYDHIEYGYYLKDLKDYNCKHVLVIDDIPSERYYEEYKINKNIINKILLYYTYMLYKNYEKRMIGRFDNIITVSEKNKEKIAKITQKTVEIIENGSEIPNKDIIKTSTGKEFNMMFLGSMMYEPNLYGVLFFLKKVIPLLDSIDLNYKLYIIGGNCTDEIKSCASEKIVVTGFVENLEEYYEKCSVMVAPILSGGGTRTKILEAMGRKTLVISTTKGCEGIDVKDGESILIANNETEFVDSIMKVYDNNELVKKVVEKAHEIAKIKYDWSNIGDKLINYYNNTLQEN